MAASKFGWIACAAAAVVVGILLGLRGQRTEQLGTQIRLKKEAGGELVGLRRAQQQLKENLPSPAQLESLRSDREAVLRLRAEIESLKANAEKAVRLPPPNPAPPGQSDALAAKNWANAGRATPRAALQTALWAAVNGEVGGLAETIAFESSAARQQAMRLLAEVSPELRAEYSTPEKLIALLSAKDMPTEGMMRVLDERIWNDNEISLATMFYTQVPPGGPPPKAKVVALKLRRENDEWKLAVPAAAVEKYAAMLRGGSAPNGK